MVFWKAMTTTKPKKLSFAEAFAEILERNGLTEQKVSGVAKSFSGTHVFTVLGSPERCRWSCKIYCFLGSHRWSYPSGFCECCGKRDNFI